MSSDRLIDQTETAVTLRRCDWEFILEVLPQTGTYWYSIKRAVNRQLTSPKGAPDDHPDD